MKKNRDKYPSAVKLNVMNIPSGLYYPISDCHGAGKPTLKALASGERRGAALGDCMMKFEFSSVHGSSCGIL